MAKAPTLELPAGLEPLRPHLQRAVAPCALLRKATGAEASSGGCRYGGLPRVPPGTRWPRAASGKPLAFIGQLDFAGLAAAGAALPQLPREGLLAFFFDLVAHPWGLEPSNRSGWRLLFTPQAADAVSIEPPEDLPERVRLRPVSLQPEPGWSLPDVEDAYSPMQHADAHALEGDPFGDYAALKERLTGGMYAHQVAGHASWVQGDGREAALIASRGLDVNALLLEPGGVETLQREARAWSLLWQVPSDTDAGLQWVGDGTAYVLLRDEDLAAHRFDAAWVLPQCF